MTDFATARRMMVDGQIRTMDVTDPRVIGAMLELPREKFLPEEKAALAYLDRDLPVAEGNSRRLLTTFPGGRLLPSCSDFNFSAFSSAEIEAGCGRHGKDDQQDRRSSKTANIVIPVTAAFLIPNDRLAPPLSIFNQSVRRLTMPHEVITLT